MKIEDQDCRASLTSGGQKNVSMHVMEQRHIGIIPGQGREP